MGVALDVAVAEALALAVDVAVTVGVGGASVTTAVAEVVGRGVRWSIATVGAVPGARGRTTIVSPFHTAACRASGARAAETGVVLVIEPTVVLLSLETEQPLIEPSAHCAELPRIWYNVPPSCTTQ